MKTMWGKGFDLLAIRQKDIISINRIKRIFRKTSSNMMYFINLNTIIPKPVFSNPDRKNILIMVESLGRGGAERVACRLASGFADSFNVVMITAWEKENQYQVDSRVQLVQIPRFYYDSKFYFSSWYVRKIKKVFRIDVAISLLLPMNCRNVYSKGKERVIVSERNNPILAYPENFGLCQRIYDRADHVVFQTREVQSMFSRKTINHSSILANPVSVSCQALKERKPRIVQAARLHKNKNQKLLIDAFATFLPKHPEYTLSIYGEGPMEEELKALVSELGIEEQVIFHGNVENIHEQMADAGMFVLSSNTEGMPNALLEAMMMGLPCISTNCTGAKEVIKNGKNGLLTKIGDAKELAAAMEYIAGHPKEAEFMRQNAMTTAEAFKIDKVIEQWKKLVI